MRWTPSVRMALVLAGIPSATGGGARGQGVPDELPGGEPFVVGHTFHLPSAALGEDRPVTVALPDGYDPGRAYPVIYLLDGHLNLVHTVGSVQQLSRSHRIPESIVVGVANTDQRNANMTPARPGERARDPSVGRAAELKTFLRDELKPWVEARYSTRPLDVLIGASLGGLFVAWVINTEPDLFDAYLSLSGNLEYDDGRFIASMDDVFDRFPDARGRLYLTMADEGGAMLASTLHLAATLQEHAPAAFLWKWKHVPAETHYSLPARATYDGLEWVFERWSPEPLWAELFERGAEVLPRIRRHFARLSEEVGFEVEPPPERIRIITRRLQLAGRADVAVPIAETLVEWAPDHFISHHALGESLVGVCRLEEARGPFREAIRLAREARRPAYFLQALEDNLDALEGRMRLGACRAPGADRQGPI